MLLNSKFPAVTAALEVMCEKLSGYEYIEANTFSVTKLRMTILECEYGVHTCDNG